jgi:large subunit ribosomal protein L9
MEVILKQDIPNVGYTNDVVKVKDGYARNFLIPKGYAIVATPSAKKVMAGWRKREGSGHLSGEDQAPQGG